MLTLYLIALVVGGALLSVGLLVGGADHDFEADADADFDADADLDADADAEASGFDASALWAPTSLRFWTFFLTFFGLTGALLAGFDLAPAWVALTLSIADGWLCGTAMMLVYNRLKREVVDSSLGVEDCLGATAQVVLTVSDQQPGKVRLPIKGRLIELIAWTDGPSAIKRGERAVVCAVRPDGSVEVTRSLMD